MLAKEVVTAIKESFISLKSRKNVLLKTYINHCATKIQKVFKGHYARKVTVPTKAAFRGLEEVANAVVNGWRVRRIMKTKEIKGMIDQIKEFIRAQDELLNDFSPNKKKDDLEVGLRASRYNTTLKLVGLVHKMEENGLWLVYKRMDARKQSGQSSSAQSESVIRVQKK